MKINELIKKYKDIILYGFFGVCTTIVNVISYWIMAHLLNASTIISSIIAWCAAVLFAYITNRKWVFHSQNTEKKDIVKEIVSFFVCRLATGVIDWGIMWIFVDKLGLNDIVIKVLSNVIVIVLNYIASKLVIFNNENKKNRKMIIKCFIIFIFIVASFVFLLKSPLSVWRQADSDKDSSVFRTIAIMMNKGYMPYVDTFDHKGPLIYFINWIGMTIDFHRGIWVIEFFSLFVTLCVLYKIARLKSSRKWSIMVTFLSISLLFKYFHGGNLTEEYAMPFIAISLYIFLDYLIKNKINIIRVIISGVCFSAVLLLRPNMISVWIVFSITIFIKCIKEKEYKKLISFILYFIAGMGSVLIPLIIFFGVKGVLADFWADYIGFNKMYTSSMKMSIMLKNRLKTLLFFSKNLTIMLTVIIDLYLWNKNKKTIFGSYFIYIILTLLFISLSGRQYDHYGMILIPVVVFPFASLYEEFL